MKNIYQKIIGMSALLIGQLVIAGSAIAICDLATPLTRPDSRYEAVVGASPAGAEIRDKVTGLIWKRCIEGTMWTGTTCVDNPAVHAEPFSNGATVYPYTFRWYEALDLARTSTPTSAVPTTPWRLPNYKELASLVQRECRPAINATWFGASASKMFGVGGGNYANGQLWTSSPVKAWSPRMWLFIYSMWMSNTAPVGPYIWGSVYSVNFGDGSIMAPQPDAYLLLQARLVRSSQ